MAKKKRRTFGRVASFVGRYQARYPARGRGSRPAPVPFPTKADADAWLDQTEAKMTLGEWSQPRRRALPFGNYADEWLADRPLALETDRPTRACCGAHQARAWPIALANLDSRTVRKCMASWASTAGAR